MLLIQLFLITFALFAILKTLTQFRAGQLPWGWLGFWVLFWLAVGVVAILPQTATILADFVGVGRGADLVVYVSLVGLFYLAFRLFVKIEQVERHLTTLVRQMALKEMVLSSSRKESEEPPTSPSV